jgi:hypothetical protein
MHHQERSLEMIGTLKFFTNGTWRPSAPLMEIPTPIGESCLACDKTINAEDCGVTMIHMDERGSAYRPWHLACFQGMLGVERIEA